MTGAFDWVTDRADGIVDVLREVDLPGDVRALVAKLRIDALLTPTFLERRQEVQVVLSATWAAYQETVGAMTTAKLTMPSVILCEWDLYRAREFRPAFIRAVQDIRGAQIRAHLELVLPRLQTLKADLEGHLAMAGGGR